MYKVLCYFPHSTQYFLPRKIVTEFNLFGQFDTLVSENKSKYGFIK